MSGSPAFNLFRDIGRNDPCPCGSGRKFKKCCLGKSEAAASSEILDAIAASDPPGEEIAEYDPMIAPDSAEWLALDDEQRITLAEDYHDRAGIRVPNARLHAVMHTIVENQIAEGDALPVGRTLQRLMNEGLDRHDAIHAIGSVLAVYLNNVARELRAHVGDKNSLPDTNDRYFSELAQLTAEKWLRSG